MHLVPHFSPQIDIMILYSEEAYSPEGSDLGKEKLRENIEDAFVKSQTAMDNSLINLDLRVVFLGQVSARVKQGRPHGTVFLSGRSDVRLLLWHGALVFLCSMSMGASCSKNWRSMRCCITHTRFLNVRVISTRGGTARCVPFIAATSRVSMAQKNAPLRRQSLGRSKAFVRRLHASKILFLSACFRGRYVLPAREPNQAVFALALYRYPTATRVTPIFKMKWASFDAIAASRCCDICTARIWWCWSVGSLLVDAEERESSKRGRQALENLLPSPFG